MYAQSTRRSGAPAIRAGRWLAVVAGVVLHAAVSFTLAFPAFAAPARADNRSAAIVLDAISGDELYDDSAGELRYPASLTKIMTVYITFEELAAGKIRLDDDVVMSEWGASRPPSKLGIRPGGTIKVRDAIKALVTKSANDVATALGEHISGTEPDFARRMTLTARRLGMGNTVFRNASGLPNPEQHTTARDLAALGLAIQRDFPQYYGVFQTRVFEFGKRRIGNHNRLLGTVEGVDGIKTGYINASGFNLVTSVRRDGRHLVAVVMGGATGGRRDARMRQLIAKYLPLATSGEAIAYAAWSDEAAPPPMPGRRPSLATRFASRLKSSDDAGDPIAQTVMAFAAETRAAVGTDALIVTPKIASDALQAVIAQADPAGTLEPAAGPLPEMFPRTAVVEASVETAALSAAVEPVTVGAGTDAAEIDEAIEDTAIDVAAAAATRDPRFAGAFAAFDGGSEATGAGDVIAAAIRQASVATEGVTIIAMGSAARAIAVRPMRMPAGRTAPVRQRIGLDKRAGVTVAAPVAVVAAMVVPSTDVPRDPDGHAAADKAGARRTAQRGPNLAHHAGRTRDDMPANVRFDDAAAASPAATTARRHSTGNLLTAAAASAAATTGPGSFTRKLAVSSPGASADEDAADVGAAGAGAGEGADANAAAAPGVWQIQVGAVPTKEAATALLDDLARTDPAMHKQSRVTLRVANGAGTIYRARFAGFPTEDAARDACKRFTNHNRPCWAVSM